MAASSHRQAIDTALKAGLLPALRAAGFTGSYPKLRRTVDDRLDLLDVQHSSSGGRFYVNLGQAPVEGFTRGDEWLSAIPPEKLETGHCGDRSRVNPASGWLKRKHGWEYGPRMYDDDVPVRDAAWYEAIASAVAKRFLLVGEAWFAGPGMNWRQEYRKS